MKVIDYDKAYIQMKDKLYFDITVDEVPIEMVTKLYLEIHDDNEFLEFKDKETVEFLKAQTQMFDYNEIRELSLTDLNKIKKDIVNKYYKLRDKFNAMSIMERSINDSIIDKCNLLQLQLYSIDEIIKFNKGQLDYQLPKGIEYPLYYKNKVRKKIFK